MAIDFMVMPMSRYISGDFVTPTMRLAWSQGLPYSIVRPDGRREIPPGSPFGGDDAPARRSQVVEMILDDLRTLPKEIATRLWDERSAAEPRFHRVDPKSYDALLTHFAAKPERSVWGFRKRGGASHCASPLLLPCEFKHPIGMVSPFERIAGAASGALDELASSRFPPEAAYAAETLRHALTDSLELQLPVIVDW
jgi:hypothetical protein